MTAGSGGDSGNGPGGDGGADGQGGSGATGGGGSSGEPEGGSRATGGRSGAAGSCGGGSSGSSNANAGSGGSSNADAGSGGSSNASAGSGGSAGGKPPVLTAIPLPAGYHIYCSVRDAMRQNFDFSWADEPCEDIIQRTGWTDAHIERTGIFDTAARSSVVMRCEVSNVYGIWTWGVPGVRALELARQSAFDGHAGQGCFFVAAPQRLPVFSAPFSLEPLPRGFEMSNSGYDFAAAPGSPTITAAIDIRLYSQNALDPSRCTPPSAGCARVVSYRGQDRGLAPEDNQQGFTWVMDAGAPLLAMAEGIVIGKRARPVTGCHTPEQNELYVRHVVGRSLESRYSEAFVVHYAHLDFAENIDVGTVVNRGQVVGYVGRSGCTDGRSQLHLAVLRETNTARDSHAPVDITPGVFGIGGANPDNSVARIDPWGWMASQTRANIDPGGYLWYWSELPNLGPDRGTRIGGGALSIALFRDGQAPPRPCDESTRVWSIEGGTDKQNPFAHCSL
jgi:murein DD-endopeptidase MepM/ murein hydrolase activator NlpD